MHLYTVNMIYLFIMQSSRSKIVRRYSKRASNINDNEEMEWGNDEVECRGENLCLVKVEEMKELMHKSIGSITFNHPHKNPMGLGTGFLISENLVLTCAHNIYDRQFKVYHQNLNFYPSAYGILSNPIEVQSYHLPQSYLIEESNKKNILYDYALLKLKQPVKQNRFLVLTVGFQGTEEALGVFGYPGKMYETMNKTATLFSAKQYGLELSGRIKTHSEDKSLKRILYEITTFPGQSGSPVIIGTNDRNKVIAIHKGGNNTMGVNYGRIITLDLLIDLQIWREECKGQPFVCIDLTNKCEIMFNGGSMFEDVKNMVKEERRKKGNGIEKQAQKANGGYQQENARLKEVIKNLRTQVLQLKAEKAQLENKEKSYEKQSTQEKKSYDFSSQKNIGQHPKPLKLTKSISFQPEPLSPSSPSNKPSSLFWDSNTPYAKNFTITSNKITLKEFGVYQIVSQYPLKSKAQVTFRVIKYGGEKDICFGIITSRKRKEMYSGGLQDEESVGCWSYPKYKEGYIYVNGKKEIDWTSDLFLRQGKNLTMMVDQDYMSIRFTNNESGYSKQLKLTDNFRSKDIYAFVCMKQKGDSVEAI